MSKCLSPVLVVDFKYNIIRIHRSTLLALGNPSFFDVLVSPSQGTSILAGDINVSRKAILRLNSLSESELKKCIEKIEASQDTRILSSMIPGHVPVKIYEPPHLDNRIIPEIKQMPKYDPDEYVSSLALTIPSWSDTIRRVRERSNMVDVSPGAAKKLIFQLGILERNIQIIRTELEGITEDAN